VAGRDIAVRDDAGSSSAPSVHVERSISIYIHMGDFVRHDQPIVSDQRCPRRSYPFLPVGCQRQFGSACMSTVEGPLRLAMADDKGAGGCHVELQESAGAGKRGEQLQSSSGAMRKRMGWYGEDSGVIIAGQPECAASRRRVGASSQSASSLKGIIGQTSSYG